MGIDKARRCRTHTGGFACRKLVPRNGSPCTNFASLSRRSAPVIYRQWLFHRKKIRPMNLLYPGLVFFVFHVLCYCVGGL